MLAANLNIFVIFLLIFVGYLLTYLKWFDNVIADVFSKLVLTISLPLNMFLNITENFSKGQFLHLMKGMLLPFLSIIITFCLSLLYVKLFHVSQNRKGTFSTMFTASNTIFIGLPINLAIFGEVSVPYVLLYYICNTTFFWSIGVIMIALDGEQVDRSKIRFDPATAAKRIFSPALMGFIIGIVWLLLDVPKPEFLLNFCQYLGDLTTPLSMFFIGIIVYQTGIRNLKMTKDVFGVLIGRYLISPFVVWGLSHWIQVPDLMLKVFIIQSAMPVQNSVPILARSYKGDTKFATTSLTFSICCYLFVIPLLLWLIF